MTVFVPTSGNLALSADARAPATGPALSGARIIWEVLKEEGVDTVFGYPGGAIMPAYDAMPDYPIRHVLVRHEQNAAHMADGYARASGQVGVAIATSGPGATNLVTGIATAMLDSIPLVVITGQVPSHLLGTDAFQETDITGLTMPITKHNALVTRAEDLAETLRQAFRLARTGRQGPVLIDVTKDAQIQSAPYTPPRLRSVTDRRPPKLTDDERAAVHTLIGKAERPIIVAGHGIIKGEAQKSLLNFVDRTQIPVACTMLGLGGFPASHPRYLGMLGAHGRPHVNEAIHTADLIIALGTRFDARATGPAKDFAPHARKIHVDIDRGELGKKVKVDIELHADVRDALDRLTPGVQSHPDLSDWHDALDQHRWDAWQQDVVIQSSDDQLWSSHVLHDLWRWTRGEALIACDIGPQHRWTPQYYPHDRPGSHITAGGFGTRGFALPAAMGARLADPNREIWVVIDDDGLQVTSPELATLVQEDLDINIAVIHRPPSAPDHGPSTPSGPVNPDFVKLAEAFGLEAIRVNHPIEMEPAIRRAQSVRRSVLIDFRVDADAED